MELEEALAFIYARTGHIKPIGKSISMQPGGLIKAYVQSDGMVGIEGWISTPAKDMENDILEPEAFQGEALKSYMARGAPVSREHNTKTLPVGYLTKSVLLRDGNVLQEESNPKQEIRDFRHFNGGTGWYASGVIYDKEAARHVILGTLGSFSWIGMPKAWEPIQGGGRWFKKSGAVDPLVETTITAYPINPNATMRIAKARGALPPITLVDMAQLMLDPEIGQDITNLLAPSLRELARSAYNDVLSLASRPSERKLFDYFAERNK